jgi:hypothetical protein
VHFTSHSGGQYQVQDRSGISYSRNNPTKTASLMNMEHTVFFACVHVRLAADLKGVVMGQEERMAGVVDGITRQHAVVCLAHNALCSTVINVHEIKQPLFCKCKNCMLDSQYAPGCLCQLYWQLGEVAPAQVCLAPQVCWSRRKYP